MLKNASSTLRAAEDAYNEISTKLDSVLSENQDLTHEVESLKEEIASLELTIKEYQDKILELENLLYK